jgi:lipoprotein-anchoring transpeptidase ErfK/SrfK
MISRRNFLRNSLLGVSGLFLRPWVDWAQKQAQFPDAAHLGRNCLGGIINVRAKPRADSTLISSYYEDQIFVWQQEVIGEAPLGLLNRKWVETPEGYIYSPGLQPVKNISNQPILSVPQTSIGKGMWVEVTVPYVDLVLANPPARSPWLKAVPRPRLYYSQVMWIDDIQTANNGQILYRVNEQYGTYGDVFWAAAEAFRPLTDEDVAPIHPDAEDKRIVVDLNHQVLSCMEGKDEVYFCRISSGAKFDAAGNVVDKWSTPVGEHMPWRKVVSIHMSGGSTGAGWDTPGIPWNLIFDPGGAAVHSTFWHNDFGTPRSHGCVNARPEDAHWIFRWALPKLSLVPGDVSLSGPGGTIVDVRDA